MFLLFGGSDIAYLLDVTKKMANCRSNLNHPEVARGVPASFNLGNYPVVCGGKDVNQVDLTSCYTVASRGWTHIGSMGIGRNRFAVIPLSRIAFLVYGIYI